MDEKLLQILKLYDESSSSPVEESAHASGLADIKHRLDALPRRAPRPEVVDTVVQLAVGRRGPLADRTAIPGRRLGTPWLRKGAWITFALIIATVVWAAIPRDGIDELLDEAPTFSDHVATDAGEVDRDEKGGELRPDDREQAALSHADRLSTVESGVRSQRIVPPGSSVARASVGTGRTSHDVARASGKASEDAPVHASTDDQIGAFEMSDLSWDQRDEILRLYEDVARLRRQSPDIDSWQGRGPTGVLSAPVGLATTQYASYHMNP